jgi:threonine dehydrogenase-like Zn-dependent dehydrogenase
VPIGTDVRPAAPLRFLDASAERFNSCGTDLHILKGDVPSVAEGRILGHEGVGVVTDVGPGVVTFRAGDRVLISCITSCVSATFDICQAILAPGGRLANVGVHGVAVALHLEKLWDRNITITTRLVDTTTTPMLLKVVGSGRLQPRKLVTHRFALDDIMQAYETFEHAAREGALKVILRNETRG